jgi:Flp pilus assembly pilin Flp
MFKTISSRTQKIRRQTFLRDQRGSTIVEFSLIVVPLFLLILAVIDIGVTTYTQVRLDSALQQTARMIMTGQVQNQKINGLPLTAMQFRDTILCPRLPATMHCQDVFVDVKTFPATASAPFDSYLNATKTGLKPPPLDNQQTSYCIGDSSDYVVMQVAYPASPVTTVFNDAITQTYKGKKTRILLSTATFRNEPFPKTSTGC